MSMETFLQQELAAGHGMPIGHDGWRIGVQALLPDPGDAVWGTAVWGTDVWSDPSWHDLTPWLQGVHWRRGSSGPYGRPEIGVADFRLDNDDGHWNTAASPLHGPGLHIRVHVRREASDQTVAQFAGIVETWAEQSDGIDGQRWVDVTVVEPLTVLAKGGEVSGNREVIGDGDAYNTIYPYKVIPLLLAASGWLYGFDNDATVNLFRPTNGLQTTHMTDNRLTESYLSADSGDYTFRSHRSGYAFLVEADARQHQRYIGGDAGVTSWWLGRAAGRFYSNILFQPDDIVDILSTPTDPGGRPNAAIVYDADTLSTVRSDRAIVNRVHLARVGGEEIAPRTDPVSEAKYGTLTYTRFDLRHVDSGDLPALGDAILSRRAEAASVTECQVTARHGDLQTNMPAVWVVDVGDLVSVVASDRSRSTLATVATIEHSLVPVGRTRVDWDTHVTFDPLPGQGWGEANPLVTEAGDWLVTEGPINFDPLVTERAA